MSRSHTLTLEKCEAYLEDSRQSAAIAGRCGMESWRMAFARRAKFLEGLLPGLRAEAERAKAEVERQRMLRRTPVAARTVDLVPSESWVAKPVTYEEPI